MKYKNKKSRFTLVELLVSLGVFSLLLIVFMQFFSGARLVWSNSEKRTQVYANVRIAMDMFSLLINSYYYSSANTTPDEVGRYLFRAHQPANVNLSHKLYFAAKTAAELPGDNPIRFIGFQVPTADDVTSYPASSCGDADNRLYNKLIMTVVSSNDPYFGAFFPPFLRINTPSAASPSLKNENGKCADVIDDLADVMNGRAKLLSSSSTPSRIELLDHVTRFNVRIFDGNGAELTPDNERNIDNIVPSMIEVTLVVLSGEDYDAWTEMNGGANQPESAVGRRFREKNEFMFTRRIYVGNR